jgi:hypothetical protein
VPTVEGRATESVVATGIGNGIGIPAAHAPSSASWQRVVVLDAQRAVVLGRALEEGIALRTGDHGRTWTSVRGASDPWVSYGVGAEGAIALVTGKHPKVTVAPGKAKPVESTRVWLAPPDAPLGAPAPLFPSGDKLKDVTLPTGLARPASLGPELAALVAERRRSSVIVFGVPAVKPQPEPIELRDRAVTAPYGRPARLLTVSGASIDVRPWPQPGEQPQPAAPIPGIRPPSDALDQLGAGPDCDAGAWSFRRVAGPGNKGWVVAVSDARAFALELAAGSLPGVGCSEDAFVYAFWDVPPAGPRAADPAKGEPQLVRCGTDGKCAQPKSHPFKLWPEEHERTIVSAATKRGVVAVLNAKKGTRWGAYLAVSVDGGSTFELPRIIGEGSTDQGFMEVAAVASLGDRVLLLLSADISGAKGRGWFVLASEDGGQTWGPP